MAAQRSPRQPFLNASTAGSDGLRSSATDARRARACRLDAIRRPRSTPIWKLEASLKCRSCRKRRYAPPVHTIRLTETQEIAPYPWGHPDEER